MIVSLKTIALSLCVVGGLSASAAALPLAKSSGLAVASNAVVLADYKKDYKYKKDHKGDFRHSPGSRYSKAPPSWHRYKQRPGNWRTRGCIIVGPIWFCP
jgi:hypothetical protein